MVLSPLLLWGVSAQVGTSRGKPGLSLGIKGGSPIPRWLGEVGGLGQTLASHMKTLLLLLPSAMTDATHEAPERWLTSPRLGL